MTRTENPRIGEGVDIGFAELAGAAQPLDACAGLGMVARGIAHIDADVGGDARDSLVDRLGKVGLEAMSFARTFAEAVSRSFRK